MVILFILQMQNNYPNQHMMNSQMTQNHPMGQTSQGMYGNQY